MQDIKVYCIDVEKQNTLDISNDMFIAIARAEGREYSLKEFTEAFNQCDINTNTDIIRIIQTPIQTTNDSIINIIDNAINDTNKMKDKDPSYVVGWLKQSLRQIKELVN